MLIIGLRPVLAAGLSLGLMATGVSADLPKISAVPVDPLIKVFRDDAVKADNSAHMEAARGEHATFQIVVPGLPVDMRELRCEVTTFTAVTTPTVRLPQHRVRYVDQIPASHTTKTPGHDQLRAAPAMFPDPLLEDETIDVRAGDNQACWITVPVPVETQPGDYKATAVLTAKVFGMDTSATLPLSMKVYPATITDTRLEIANWFQIWHRGDQPTPEQYSEQWWDMLKLYVDDMVAHRQTMARVETLWIVKYVKDENGKLAFDFSNFDRWVQLLFDAGIEKVESLQFAWRTGKWEEPFGVETHAPGEVGYKGGKAFRGTMVPPDSPEAREFYSQWFPAFTAHLREKGWLDKFVQHVGDEPVTENAASYMAAAKLVRDYAPELPIMEACLSHDMVGSIDIWVPILQHLHKDFAFFKERQNAGDELWFYTCVNPQGEYANRFLEQPLIKTRLLHWINFRYNITGYLHWGYNFWRPHPWDNGADPKAPLPAGDMNIVYPAKDSYGIIGSIRWEAMRDGIEDHELLSQLGDKNPEAAMALAKRLILDFDKYVTDVRSFRQTRRELLQAVSEGTR
jgi:hypothetical protein